MIVATAGHVDHGKTELVRALTGIDTDRLPEEKARGLSIDLGFAYQSLPNEKSIGYVDVPGHEKFIRNMLAGVGGIDLGLLVVAADDGVMPQTREHFAILDLLGIDQCVVAITKIDRVDDDRIPEVQQQIETLLEEAGHRAPAIYPVCAPDNHGVDALKSAILAQAQSSLSHDPHGYFRLAIDRVFTLRGVGLVVTGMVFAGTARIDERLLLSSDGSEVRIRGIRAHDEFSHLARAGERCAINISGRGIDEHSVRRGDWLLHANLFAPTRRIDVDLRVLQSEAKPMKHWTPTYLHNGADRIPARVAVLDGGSIAAGEHGLAQLVLERDAFVLHGDRFVLRDQSAQRTMAGGHIIDPFSPKRGRSRPERIEMLRALDRQCPEAALTAAADLSETGVPSNLFSIARNLSPTDLDALIESRPLCRVGDRVFSHRQWQIVLDRIEQVVAEFNASNPNRPGAILNQIQLGLKPHIDTAVLEHALATLTCDNRLGQRGTYWHLPQHEILVSERDRRLLAQVGPHLAPETGSPMSLQQAAAAIGSDARTLEAALKDAIQAGEMVQISKNRYLPSAYLSKLKTRVTELAARSEHGFTVVDYGRHIQTGRNFAIDVLEYFDRTGLTRRDGNLRHIRKS